MASEQRLIYPARKLWEPVISLEKRLEKGKKQREYTAREAHATMASMEGRSDPVQLLIDSSVGRVESLLPIRYARMLTSAFAYLRGSAIVMAEDLSNTPNSGIYVQCCGDCHLMNFGGYATPERNQVFDISDFDETLPAPFEWDLKRLAASVVVAGRFREFSEKVNKKAAFTAVKSYTDKIREFAEMRQLEIWYNRLDDASILKAFKTDDEFVKKFRSISEKAKHHTHEFVFPRISEVIEGKIQILDDPPLIYHPPDTEHMIQSGHVFFDAYYDSLADDKKALIHRYKLDDIALKVVGVGSVGTRCLIGLFTADAQDAIILQFKEGSPSVLEKYAGSSQYTNHGERIVNGQRLMQTVSDIFLGWAQAKNGTNFYVRQLRDMKSSANINNFTPNIITDYAALCGWALAKSHAKAGRAPEISGYLGKSDIFAQAVAEFAVQYADRTEKDYELLKKAEKDKRIVASPANV